MNADVYACLRSWCKREGLKVELWKPKKQSSGHLMCLEKQERQQSCCSDAADGIENKSDHTRLEGDACERWVTCEQLNSTISKKTMHDKYASLSDKNESLSDMNRSHVQFWYDEETDCWLAYDARWHTCDWHPW